MATLHERRLSKRHPSAYPSAHPSAQRSYEANVMKIQLVTEGTISSALAFSGFAAVTKKCLAPKCGIVLQQVIDISDPIILFSWPDAFLAWLFVSIVGDRRAINARHWIWRSMYRN